MKLDVIYRCSKCGSVAVESKTISPFRGSPFDLTPICDCGIEHLTSSLELHTRDEN